MKIKNKILIILAVIIASLFFYIPSAYANFVVDDVTLPDVPSDAYSDYALFYDGSYYVLVKYNYGEYFLKYSSSRLYICNSSGSSQNYLEVAKAYRYKTTGWTLLNGADRYYYGANPVYYTNQDIYSDVASKTVAISANIGIPESDLTLIDPLKTALTSSITPEQPVTVLAGIVGVGMTFFLMWFGGRKIKQIFISAVTKGKT